MNADTCRGRLTQLFKEELMAFGALEELLEKEYEVLQSKDVAALQQSMEARQERMRTLVRIDDTRRSLCRERGLSVDGAGLKSLLAWCDPTGSLREHWKEVAARAGRCRRLNDRNGALVIGRTNRLQALSSLLNEHEKQAATYSARGGYSTPKTTRNLGAA